MDPDNGLRDASSKVIAPHDEQTQIEVQHIQAARHTSCFVVESEREAIMLWTLAVLLVVLWALGLVTSYTMGGFIHILLVVAVVVVVLRVIQGRRIT
jgi:hypothetical protein